jgi:ribosomal protein S18 acetylase RimI-like enzyme
VRSLTGSDERLAVLGKGTMNLLLRPSQPSDLPFLREMLYEAVFWRAGANTPSFEEGLAYPEVRKELADWGERHGDVAVVATIESIPVGAAWVRFWRNVDGVRGFVDEHTPVLVIGVHRDYRRQGIGKAMIEWLVDHASKHHIQQISLCVSKDNYALNLYRQMGFVEHEDLGHSFNMVRQI